MRRSKLPAASGSRCCLSSLTASCTCRCRARKVAASDSTARRSACSRSSSATSCSRDSRCAGRPGPPSVLPPATSAPVAPLAAGGAAAGTAGREASTGEAAAPIASPPPSKTPPEPPPKLPCLDGVASRSRADSSSGARAASLAASSSVESSMDDGAAPAMRLSRLSSCRRGSLSSACRLSSSALAAPKLVMSKVPSRSASRCCSIAMLLALGSGRRTIKPCAFCKAPSGREHFRQGES